MIRIIENKNTEYTNNVKQKLKENDGYCPCRLKRDESTKCMCEDFRKSTELGFCKCQLFERVNFEE